VNLSVLDFGLLRTGQTANGRLAELRREVAIADLNGYRRYWLAEHHNVMSSWASPEVLIPALASNTTNIRIGTAGILLTVYNPLKVANDFSLLSHLYPHRLDLGLARGWPSQNTRDLMEGSKPDEATYGRKLRQLIRYLFSEDIASRSISEAIVVPSPPLEGVQVWLMGTQHASMRLASELGTAFCYSMIHAIATPTPDVLVEYQSSFQPGTLKQPLASIAVAGCCAETEAKANRLLAAHGNKSIISRVVGNPRQCQEQLSLIIERYRAAEIVFLDLAINPDDRLATLELMAMTCGLKTRVDIGL
jgi:luciferase family oxidoreductase group 1